MSGQDVERAINRKIIDHQDKKYREITAPAGLTASINKAQYDIKTGVELKQTIPMSKRL